MAAKTDSILSSNSSPLKAGSSVSKELSFDYLKPTAPIHQITQFEKTPSPSKLTISKEELYKKRFNGTRLMFQQSFGIQLGSACPTSPKVHNKNKDFLKNEINPRLIKPKFKMNFKNLKKFYKQNSFEKSLAEFPEKKVSWKLRNVLVSKSPKSIFELNSENQQSLSKQAFELVKNQQLKKISTKMSVSECRSNPTTPTRAPKDPEKANFASYFNFRCPSTEPFAKSNGKNNSYLPKKSSVTPKRVKRVSPKNEKTSHRVSRKQSDLFSVKGTNLSRLAKEFTLSRSSTSTTPKIQINHL